MPRYKAVGWFGLMAPSGTPQSIIREIHEDSTKAMQGQDFVQRLAQLGMVPYVRDPESFARTIKEETVLWAKIVKEVGIKVE